MDPTGDIEVGGSSRPQPTQFRISELYDTLYDGPTVKMIRECKFCTTPFWYYVNNVKGIEMLMIILLMMCGPVGAHMLFEAVFPYRPGNPFVYTLISGAPIWAMCYILGACTAGFLVFGEAMEILRYADAAFWLYYYRKIEAKEKQNDAMANLESSEVEVTNESSSAPIADASAEKEPIPFRMQGALIRCLFKFRTNNVMQDGEFLPLTPCQWFMRATWLERICHILIPLRWIMAAVMLAFFFTYNYTMFFMTMEKNFLLSDIYFCMLQFMNGMSHVAMVYMGWKIALVLLDLWRKSRGSNLRKDFLRVFFPLPDGLRYIPDPKFAFVMDGCPCSYVAPEALALPPEYEQTTHFHGYYAHIFKTIFCFTTLIIVSICAMHSFAAGIMYIISTSVKQQETLLRIIERQGIDVNALVGLKLRSL
ncbi:CCR4-NOT transcription complex subunit 1, putative [Babesia ovata]|uniref:CCR4-NOT transcription complex subunit 1, putative n=1 Tax=Babesia ovata TaxID=189622 RepID=A0A2H6KD01_9APIC|nr:CCR4-NOT transcription complex subunit 1, putative [Babesia ovata]GBE60854.1 CCR4-NOT transcription complex subunit 1, putative [Babesia ovata]